MSCRATNSSGATTLYDITFFSWLKDRIPPTRHKDGRINVAFCDGHAETIMKSTYKKVRITPYR